MIINHPLILVTIQFDFADTFEDEQEAIVCTCPCHTPDVLEEYHRPILAAFKYYLPKIDHKT